MIRHSISKPYYKEKLRLRSYNIPTSLNDKVFLELKKKINGIVNKRRVVMTLGEVYEFLENGKKPCFDDYENKQVIKEIEYYLSKNKVWFTKILSDLEIYNTHYSKYGNEYMMYCLENKNNNIKRSSKVC